MQVRPPAFSSPRDWIDWPFFDVSHREFATRLDCFVDSRAVRDINHGAVDETCRKLVRALGEAGLLEVAVPSPDGDASDIDSRAVCLARETLARRNGLADFAFAMQGLGSGAVAIAGSAELRTAVLPKARSGEWLAAFALSEKHAGSDVAAMACSAHEDGDCYVINGEKTWISNGGIADFYTLFARTGEAPGARGISAFVVFPDDPGFSISERIDVIAPHPLATLRFEACRIPRKRRLGTPGSGFKIAMQTLDIFRASVAAAALGFARRALGEGIDHARNRRIFGGTLADLQLTQAALGDMATEIDAAALLTYRAAWRRDVQKLSTTREAAMAKMPATETSQRVIDRAVQIFGGRGVMQGEIVESLYREIRSLRNRGPKADRRARIAEVAPTEMNTFEESLMHRPLHPEGWPRPAGYANGVVAQGRTIFLAGQVGWNAEGRFESDDLVAQIAQALRNVTAVLACERAGPEHVTNLVWYFIDKREYINRLSEVGKVYREIMGKNFPAMTAVQVSALIEDRAKVEIQATAVLQD